MTESIINMEFGFHEPRRLKNLFKINISFYFKSEFFLLCNSKQTALLTLEITTTFDDLENSPRMMTRFK
jgi:hypothetical protein